ncbi:ABC transporter substrate-binding protein [Nisaea acidiphila]|uniref:ABC transporter substrate-binding protein n=1 Tax=Nisaea acidiphila TaxID=1862145 RepID=A0A9J7AT26_9PROT|nr:ABC transporter substrate-binding protein [Nisaea acidiphila]UUX50326.1 ABC transporter substrate-binding protein [Nisaea acidiphila]
MKSKLFAAALLATTLGAAGNAAAKDSLALGIGLEPPHLDPTAGAAAAIDEVVYANVFEGLTRIGPDGAVLPALAKSWSVSENGLTYTFKLQDGVAFHDGTGFDSADVLFSLNRAMAEDSTNAQKGLFEPIEKVEAPDATTVVITLKRPTGHFLFNLGWGDAVIVAPESAGANKSNPVGTGPFSFKRWAKGSEINLARNDAYWGTKAKLTKVSFKIMPDAAASAAALMSGDVDAIPNFGAPELLEQFRSDPRFLVMIGTTEGETILSMNHANEALSDIRVRRAISHAIDRQAIIDGAMFGSGTPIGSHFAPHHPAYIDLTGMYPHDTAKAKALLAEAGYADGLKLRLTLPPPSYARRGGEVIAAQLAAVGIETEIIPVEWAQWLKQVFKTTDYDLTIVSHTEPFDIGIYARDSYYFNYKSDRFRNVYSALTEAVDPTERNSLIGEAQKILAEDAVNGFLFELAQNGVWRTKIKGLWRNRPIQANDVTGAYWE